MTELLNIVAIATAVSGQESKLRTAQQRLVAETVTERGCLKFELFQSLDDARVLVFTETWATEIDWRAHMQGSAIRSFQASGAPQLIQDFKLLRLQPLATLSPLNV